MRNTVDADAAKKGTDNGKKAIKRQSDYGMTENDSLSAWDFWIMTGAAVLLIIVVAAVASWLNNRKN